MITQIATRIGRRAGPARRWLAALGCLAAFISGCALNPPGGENTVSARGIGLELYLVASAESPGAAANVRRASPKWTERGWDYTLSCDPAGGGIPMLISVDLSQPGRIRFIRPESGSWCGVTGETLRMRLTLPDRGEVQRLPDGPTRVVTVIEEELWNSATGGPDTIEFRVPRRHPGTGPGSS